MNFADEIARLMKRELATLLKHVEGFPSDEALWQTVAGVTNSAGNLVLHLEGNLREYVGRQLGGNLYTRDREAEFTSETRFSRDELVRRVQHLVDTIPAIIASLSPNQLASNYPEIVLERAFTVHGFVVHLYGHLGWHMGQVDSIRRVLTEGGPIQRASL